MCSEAEQTKVKKRITYFDVISIFSCLCVLIVHFNATVAGYDGTLHYPENSLIPNFYLDHRVYLGDIGVSMFFMLSGARLMYSWKGIRRFYINRFKNIYPMYWIAFSVATMVDFLHYKVMPSDSLVKLLLSIAGMDGYLMQLGVVSTMFYRLGDWFLGCILFLYCVFPLLRLGVEKCPVGTVVAALIVYIVGIRYMKETVFFLRIPEMLFGMFYVKYHADNYAGRLTIVSLALLIVAYVFRGFVVNLTVCIALSMTIFNFLTFLSRWVRNKKLMHYLGKASMLIYPVFLTHHWIIVRIVEGFNLQMLSRRDIYMLFITYIVITLMLSSLLQKLGSRIVSKRREEVIRV